MVSSIQEGIFLGKETPGNSTAIVFLRTGSQSSAPEIGNQILSLWQMLQDLKRGITLDLHAHRTNLYGGDLNVLIGYGKKIFNLDGVLEKCPEDVSRYGVFEPPKHTGGGEIVDGSELHYENDLQYNHALDDDIILQFIGDNEFTVSRAVTETWKSLSKGNQKYSSSRNALYITRVYSGFLRDDRRNWFGFHDGVSNIESKRRYGVVAVTRDRNKEKWMTNGTFLSFMRIIMDLDGWEKNDLTTQELMVGRDKQTGCPLIGIDKSGKPIKDKSCPIRGTFEIFEKGNERFREHPVYGAQKNLPYRSNDSILKESHVGRAVILSSKATLNDNSLRIFRQSYNYIEPSESSPGFKVGLNFISFQNSTERFFTTLRYAFGPSKFNSQGSFPRLVQYLSVKAAGVFIIPPTDDSISFPGANIFLKDPKNKYKKEQKPRYFT